jgi:pimeloyl-ACP methyl ester carboxylesterase
VTSCIGLPKALVDTPALPEPKKSGRIDANGARLWYATFGSGAAVTLLHGGLANSNYWDHLVRQLAGQFEVIVCDSRGHGRSLNETNVYSYEAMTEDVVALLDHLKIERTGIVGWSDGANVGLLMVLSHPRRMSRLIAFAGNLNPGGTMDPSDTAVFKSYMARTKTEYESLSPTPGDYAQFLSRILKMWETQPNIQLDELARIVTPTWIMLGERDEAISRSHTETIASAVPGAGLVILPRVSHFAFLQDALLFNSVVLHLLTKKLSVDSV